MAGLTQDEKFMKLALGLARRGLGRVWPNPAVGCVLVNQAGTIVGRGWTQPSGRPHAETVALAQAGGAAKGATAYVTLEPCSHTGQTPPCAQALIDAGVRRVVVAAQDVDPRVQGRGLGMLRDAGVEVETSVLEQEALALNNGFFNKVEQTRPMITLKLGTSLDSRIATHSGQSQWITGAEARKQAHMLRANHDAILVGIGTVLADNPELTCRVDGLEDRSPIRIVIDSRMQVPLVSKLVASARKTPFWLVTLAGGDELRLQALKDAGVEVIEAPSNEVGLIDLKQVMSLLAERGLTRILVEGGAHIAASLAADKLIDAVEWFRAPRLIGGDGMAALTGFGTDTLDMTRDFAHVRTHKLGDDVWESYCRK